MLRWLAIVVLIIQYFVWLVTWQLIEDLYKFDHPEPVEFIDMMQNQRVTEKGWMIFFFFVFFFFKDNFLERGSNSYLNIVCMWLFTCKAASGPTYLTHKHE